MTHIQQLTSYTGFNVHNSLKGLSVPELKKIADKDRLDYAVVCLNLEKDLNLSNIVRSSHCLGVKDVFILGDKKFDSRGCVGSQNYTNIHKHRISEDEIISYIRNVIIGTFDYTPCFIDKTKDSKSILTRSFRRYSRKKPCLIFGNENNGIPDKIYNSFKSYPTFHIDQLGVIRSMNVSSAASIVIHEAKRNIEKNAFFSIF